jgi:uncharacterized protein
MRFEDLEDFLLSDRAPESVMMVSDLDGFLTGIAVSPDLIMPSEWLERIWGADGAPTFADADDAQAVIGAIMSRFQEIGRAVETGRASALDPVYWATQDGTRIAGDWAEGFMDAVRMRPSAWQPLFDDRDGILYAAPILALCCDESGQPVMDLANPQLAKIHADAPAMIPEAVISIERFWRQRQGRDDRGRWPPAQSRRVDKVGRNAPCPCGSGRKYKVCCGR